MTWRWNAFSMRLTPTRPSRTRSELRRAGISGPNHVGPRDPVLQPALLAVEPDPEESEEQRRNAREVAGAARGAPCRRRRLAVDVDDFHLEHAHAERAAERHVEHEQIDHA